MTLLKRTTLASTALLLVATAALSGCHLTSDAPTVPLPPELAAIQCPADRAEHANAMFGKARLIFLCVDKRQAQTPSLLRCDREFPPMVCGDTGDFILSRDADGHVYSGPPPNYAHERDNHGPTTGPTDDSQLIVNFHSGPPSRPTFDPVETQWRFLLPGGQDLLPDGFTFVKGTLCDRTATVLDTGMCNIEATTPSMYWHIAISLHHKNGTPIYDREYRTELTFWMKYLGLMVLDPKN
jgi:hypothetical protein